MSATSAGMVPQVNQRTIDPTMVIANPKLSTKKELNRLDGMGRTLVRFIIASRSDSYHILRALAPPDARVVPIAHPIMSFVQSTQPVTPYWRPPMSNPTVAVMVTSLVIPGLVSSLHAANKLDCSESCSRFVSVVGSKTEGTSDPSWVDINCGLLVVVTVNHRPIE